MFPSILFFCVVTKNAKVSTVRTEYLKLLNHWWYPRSLSDKQRFIRGLAVGSGFEPLKAKPVDLQSRLGC